MKITENLCVGCGNCYNSCTHHAINMEYNNKGFWHPVINMENCINCGACKKNCIANINSLKLENGKRWYAAYEIENYMPEESTSGGVADAAARKMIENRGVVYGCCYLKNNQVWCLDYIRVDKENDLSRICGSKYAQASAFTVYSNILSDLKNNIQVLFIGTPCQVAALKVYVPKCYHNLLFTIDFICHGTPSPKIASDYLYYLESEKYKKEISKYNFRSKKPHGWGKLRVEICFEDSKEKNYRADFCPLHGWFGKHLSLNDACFNCRFRGKMRASDITIADFWNIEKYYKDIPSQQGLSAVQINSDKGQHFFESLDSSLLCSYKVTEQSVWETRNTDSIMFIPEIREAFFNDYLKGGIKKIIKEYPADTYFSLVRDKISSFLK